MLSDVAGDGGLVLGADFGRSRGRILDTVAGGGWLKEGLLSCCIGNFFGNGEAWGSLAIAIFCLRRYFSKTRAMVICSCSSLFSGSVDELAASRATSLGTTRAGENLKQIKWA